VPTGGVIFTVAISLLLIGLTNKGLVDEATRQIHQWTDPSVGGLILAGLTGLLPFIGAEARAQEPTIPPDPIRRQEARYREASERHH